MTDAIDPRDYDLRRLQNDTTHPIIGKWTRTPEGDGFAIGFDPGDENNPPMVAVVVDQSSGAQWFEMGDVERLPSQFSLRTCSRTFAHAPHDWQAGPSEWFRCSGVTLCVNCRERPMVYMGFGLCDDCFEGYTYP